MASAEDANLCKDCCSRKIPDKKGCHGIWTGPFGIWRWRMVILNISLKLFGRFIELFDIDEKEISLKTSATVMDLLNSLCNTEELRSNIFSSSSRSLKPNVVIRKNGRFIIHLNWLDTELEEGDRVDILTLHCGG
jgi:sulfur carrier protein ThiS